MNIYVERDYRSIIKQLIEDKKREDGRASFQHLAETIRVPKSYVSKVMNGRADFSADQIFLAARYFNLDENEARYLDVLVDIERSALQQRKDILKEHAESLRKPFLNTESNLAVKPSETIADNFDEYYLNPVNLLIHQCLTINRYRLNPNLLYQDLNLSRHSIDRSLGELVKLGIVKKEHSTYRVIIDDIHLSSDNKLYPIWRDKMKMLTVSSFFQTSSEENRYFSAVATISLEGRDRLVKSFFEFINSVKDENEPGPDDDVYQINFDFIRWTESSS